MRGICVQYGRKKKVLALRRVFLSLLIVGRDMRKNVHGRAAVVARVRAAVAAGRSALQDAEFSRKLRSLSVIGRREATRLARRMRPRSPRTLVRTLGAIVAVATALIVPVGYGIIGYIKETDNLTHAAELTAMRAAPHVYAYETPWRYDTRAMATIEDARMRGDAPTYRRILDIYGQPLVSKRADLAWPIVVRRAPVFASGVQAGTVEVFLSVRPLLLEVLFVFLGSLVLGIAAYLAFAVLPLRVVDRSLGELKLANTRLELQNDLLREREEKLDIQNQRLDAAMDSMAHGLVMFDAKERVVVANDRFANLFGLAPADVKPGTSLREIVEKRIAAGLVEGTANEYLNSVRTRIASGKVTHVTNRLTDGRVLMATVHPRGDGGWLATHQDITEHERLTAQLASRNELLQQREAQLRAQNLRFDTALENMVQGLAMFDENSRIVIANDEFAAMYGLTREQVKPGTSLREVTALRIGNGLYAGLTVDQVLKTMRDRVARGRVSHLTSKLGDGRTITVSIRPTMGGGWVTTHQDITERENLTAQLARQNELLQQREEELEAYNMRFNAALSSMSQGFCLFDANQRVVIANDRYAELYGLQPDQIKPGATLRDILEARVGAGAYSHIDARAFVDSAIASFSREASNVVRLSDGRYLSVLRRPLPDGGLVTTHEDVTERERLNDQLDIALNNMSHGLALFDEDQRLLVCNKLYAEMYKLTPEQVKPGTTVRQIIAYRADNGCYREADLEGYTAQQAGKFGKIDSEIHKLADGRIINVSHRRATSGGHVITHQDVTERQTLLARLEDNHRLLGERTSRLQTIIDSFPGGIAFLDKDLRMVLLNERGRRLLDLPDALFVEKTPSMEEVVRFNAQRGDFGPGDAEESVAAHMAQLTRREGHVFELDRPDGTTLEVRSVPLGDGGFVTTYMDVTERRRSEAKIAHMALHDALTGLANRVLLNERLDQALARVKRGDALAVHLLDLDHFKHVNDTMGHPAGDKLLRDVAERLRALVRETDTIARMGGDEFAILQVGITGPGDASVLARRVIDSICQPFDIEGRQVIIGTSVGIAAGPTDGQAADELMRNADLALYRAKGDGRGTYRFFEAGMDEHMQERRALEMDLRKALPDGEFELYYQPIVSLGCNRITAVEALLRWNHPERGQLLPNVFIPLAEATGFIVPLGEWVIRQACTAAAQWPGNTRVSVNLSPVQFKNPGLVQVVVGALAATGLAAHRLELEITESTLLHDSDATLATLYRLREIGVRIAMDDFGTGYSSLGYLQSFPFDRIKIDRSFIKDITEGIGSLNIVRAVAALGRGLGMQTTAEGVETSDQLETVRAEGCTEVQGYLFGKPQPGKDIAALLATPGEAEASAA
jgi:diguanylate cyclase (GGDEF)-like protein/PAS domain S-box-containing protein